MKLRSIILFLHLLLFTSGWAQDSILVLNYDEYLSIVREHHPISYQAELKEDQGNALVQKAKGGFDPKIYGEINQKNFDGKQYYSRINSGLKIPTWFGLSLEGGFENNSGEYLNPENYTPTEGLWYAGVSVNIGNGLFIDRRRAELKQAEIYQNSSLIEQRLIMNQLIFDATIAYWEWFKSYNMNEVNKMALENAQIRLEAIIQSSYFGDLPSVDTLKAKILVQERQLKFEQTSLELTNKRAQLEVFLWEDGFIPLELGPYVVPNEYDDLLSIQQDQNAPVLLDSIISAHPEILLFQNEIEISKIDFRLKREELKPTIQLKYNALSRQTNTGPIQNYNANNYTWGAQISYPIFTRKERGALQLTEIKIKEQETKIIDKYATIKYKIESSFNTWNSLSKQVSIYSKAVNNYELLFEAELELFEVGESSLFLVNVRDQEMIESQLKLTDIIYKNFVSMAEYNYQILGF
jgi:outer membrane protein TolC